MVYLIVHIGAVDDDMCSSQYGFQYAFLFLFFPLVVLCCLLTQKQRRQHWQVNVVTVDDSMLSSRDSHILYLVCISMYSSQYVFQYVFYCLLASYTEAVAAVEVCGKKCCRSRMSHIVSSSSDSMYSSQDVLQYVFCCLLTAYTEAVAAVAAYGKKCCRSEMAQVCLLVQGGEDPQDALSSRLFFAKEPLSKGLFCGK